MGLVSKLRIDLVIKKPKVDKTLGFNNKIFVAVRFYFVSTFFSMFYSHSFLNISFIDQQYFFLFAKIENS